MSITTTMAESPPPPPSLPPNPNHMVPPIPHTDAPQSPASPISLLSKRPKLRVTSEFDSDTSLFFHKVSCKVLDSFAKLKLSFQNNNKGEPSQPSLLSLPNYSPFIMTLKNRMPLSRLLSILVLSSILRLPMMSRHNKERWQWLLTWAILVMHLKSHLLFQLLVCFIGEKEEEEARRTLSVSGIVKSQLTYGIFTAQFSDEDLKLRYCYKDETVSFIPSISLPSSALSFAFKRRFTPSNKLSYWYNFDSNNWSTVYKHTYGKDLKFKAGYDSDASLGWASLWVSIPIY
ncbi:hypothetical protein NC652_038872 [Populus alba x Populus x berolinensis]|nr:hypothetical protein NC652_038872 [Populus alba x Populus x berolinensis]